MADIYPTESMLLIDDENQTLQSMSTILRMAGLNNLVVCQDSRNVQALLDTKSYSVITLDLEMPHISGLELLPYIVQHCPQIPVIVVTSAAEIDTAVDCMRYGAFDYLQKPIDKTRLVTSVKRAFDASEMREENIQLKESLLSKEVKNPVAFASIITQSSLMESIFKYIDAVGKTSLPVLITGETGTGKELVARTVHNISGRDGDFVAVNVSGLDDTMFSDTLFGHVKGAYTGAVSARDGMIKRAESGTVFLDEIGDLALESQIKLLRLLQEREYYPLGTDRPRTTDARFVVATNRDLEECVKNGEFRNDLYYRLRSHSIRVPPLRERVEDIPILVNFFVERALEDLGGREINVPEEIYSLLRLYQFPGNIRELQGMIYDAAVRAESGTLSLEAIKIQLPEENHVSDTSGVYHGPKRNLFGEMDSLPPMDNVVQMLVDEALSRAGGNISVAAKMMKMDRSTLSRRLKHQKT